MAEPTVHWTVLRKMELVQAVGRKPALRQDVLTRHAISEEEFAAWETAYAERGLDGLRTGHARVIA